MSEDRKEGKVSKTRRDNISKCQESFQSPIKTKFRRARVRGKRYIKVENVRYLRLLSNPNSYGHPLNSAHFIIMDSFPSA